MKLLTSGPSLAHQRGIALVMVLVVLLVVLVILETYGGLWIARPFWGGGGRVGGKGGPLSPVGCLVAYVRSSLIGPKD